MIVPVYDHRATNATHESESERTPNRTGTNETPLTASRGLCCYSSDICTASGPRRKLTLIDGVAIENPGDAPLKGRRRFMLFFPPVLGPCFYPTKSFSKRVSLFYPGNSRNLCMQTPLCHCAFAQKILFPKDFYPSRPSPSCCLCMGGGQVGLRNVMRSRDFTRRAAITG